jgi:hypothetical protein
MPLVGLAVVVVGHGMTPNVPAPWHCTVWTRPKDGAPPRKLQQPHIPVQEELVST